jgi:hypothetical protein
MKLKFSNRGTENNIRISVDSDTQDTTYLQTCLTPKYVISCDGAEGSVLLILAVNAEDDTPDGWDAMSNSSVILNDVEYSLLQFYDEIFDISGITIQGGIGFQSDDPPPQYADAPWLKADMYYEVTSIGGSGTPQRIEILNSDKTPFVFFPADNSSIVDHTNGRYTFCIGKSTSLVGLDININYPQDPPNDYICN